MSTLAFDTHKAIKKLKNVGIPEDQAEAQVSILTELVQNELVTKNYLHNELNSLKLSVGGMLVIAVGVLVGFKYWG